jgi:hypothetical protein
MFYRQLCQGQTELDGTCHIAEGSSYWIVDRREGCVWMDEPVTMASGVKKVYEAK